MHMHVSCMYDVSICMYLIAFCAGFQLGLCFLFWGRGLGILVWIPFHEQSPVGLHLEKKKKKKLFGCGDWNLERVVRRERKVGRRKR